MNHQSIFGQPPYQANQIEIHMPVYHSKLSELVFPIAAGLSFLGLMAQLSFEFQLHDLNIPITGQSLAVLLIGYVFGKRIGPIVILLYLIIGCLGAPVFANGAAGFSVLLKGSGGFLYGFLFGAAVAGQFREYEWGRSFLKSLVIMTLGTMVIIAFGVFHLSLLYGFEKALEYGFYPFWRGAIVKIIVGAGLLPIWYQLESKWKEKVNG